MRSIALTVLGALFATAANAASADDASGALPIQIPPGWTRQALTGVMSFANWTNGNATFSVDASRARPSTVPKANEGSAGRLAFPAILEDHIERLDRCSTEYSLETIRRKQDDGSVHRIENLDYIAGDVA